MAKKNTTAEEQANEKATEARSNDSVAEQEARIAALEAENTRLKEENQAVRITIGANDHTGKVVDGEFTSQYEDPNTGDVIEKTVRFQPGFVFCRIPGGFKVSSAALMKLANGVDLSDEEKAANPELANLGVDGAKKHLTNMIAKGATFLKEVGAVLALLVCCLLLMPADADAQFRSGQGPLYPTLDTLTNADTTYFTITDTRMATDRDAYDYAWHLNISEVSGTASCEITVQESLFTSGDKWFTVSTDTVTASSQTLLSGNLTGIRQRIMVRTFGTGVYRVEPAVRYRRKTSF